MTNLASAPRILILLLLFVLASARADSVLNFVAVGNGADGIATNPITNVTYVANSLDNTVSIFSGTSGTVEALGVGTAPIAIAINPLTNKIYVANQGSANVSIIDGVTENVTVVGVGANPMAIAVNPATNTIYVANFENGASTPASTVSVIDGASGAALTPITVGESPYAIGIDEVANLIYVLNYGDGSSPGTVSYIDGATNTVLDTIPVGVGPAAIAVNPLTTKAYIVNSRNNTVSVIDGETAAASTVNVGSGPVAIGVNPVTNLIYVVNEGGNSLSIIDGNTQAVGAISVEADPTAVAIDVATNKIYVPTNPTGAGSLDILDANTGVVTTLSGVGASGTVATTILGTPIAVDPLTHRVYLAASSTNAVAVIDASVTQQSTVPVGNSPDLIAINPVTDLAYVVNAGAQTVTVLHDNGIMATVAVGGGPNAIAINSAANMIYVANLTDSTVTEINGSSEAADTIALSGAPSVIAVNPATNTVYVGGNTQTTGSGFVAVLNRTTGSASTVNIGSDPLAIAVNPATNQIYIATDANSLIVMDGATLTTTTIQVGNLPTAIAIDTATNQIYVGNQDDETITAINGATNTVAQVISLSGEPSYLAINPITRQVYAGSGNTGSIFVFTEGSSFASTINVSSTLTGIAVNPATNTVYACGAISTAGMLTTIDGASSAVTVAPVGNGPLALAVNPANGEVFVVNANDNTVSLIQSSPGSEGDLTTFIQPIKNNVAHSTAPTLNLTATSLAGPIRPAIEQIFYQVDSLEGPWLFASPAADSPASALASLSGLSVGPHTLFAFAADGEESTDDNTGIAASPIVGAISAYSFLINPGTFSFTVPSTLTYNNAASVTVTVQRNFTDPSSVSYQTVDGGGVAGTDYVTTTGTLTFAQDELTKLITIPLLPGLAVQTSVNFYVQLSNPATLSTLGPDTELIVLNSDSADVQLSLITPTAPTAPGLATGSIEVDLTPNTDGEQWRLFGSLDWQDSGAAATGLTAGTYEIEFKPVNGFQAPSLQVVTLTAGETTSIPGTYTATSNAQPQGSLTVTLVPAGTGGWRFQGETLYRASGVPVPNLTVGSYILEFEQVTGFSTPENEEVIIQSGVSTAITVTYYVADATTGATPVLVPSSVAQTMTPYEFLGQIQTDSGLGSGFVPLDQVVVTAAHVIFDDGTLTYVQGVRWFFQYEVGVYEAPVQIPRGAYVFDGYAAQRTADEAAGIAPGVSSTASQQLDAAALFFLEPAARGGQSGYLASNSDSNTWLTGGRQKLIAGYPADGVPANTVGMLYATLPVTSGLQFDTTGLFKTTALTSFEGNSGGPLCVQFDDGAFYPAAIYLGGTNETVVRAIDSQVIDLMNTAEMAGHGVQTSLPEGVTLVNLGISGNTSYEFGSVSVTMGPAGALAAGAQWELTSDSVPRTSGSAALGLAPTSYTVNFTNVAGYNTPAPQNTTVTAGATTTLTAAYTPKVAPTITSATSASTGLGQYFQYQITASYDPTTYSSSALPAGLTLNTSTGLIYGTPTKAGMTAVTLTAANMVNPSPQFTLNITVIPPGQLTVSTTGKGSVTAKYAHITIQPVGSAVSITATPAAGYLFASWSLPGATTGAIGSILSTQPTYRFTMLEQLQLQANFIVNPFLTSKGSYLGLLQGGFFENSGTFQCTVGSLGSFTATLTLGGYAKKFVNSFTDQGQFNGPVVLPDGRVFNLTLQLTANAILSGTVTSLADNSQLSLSAARAAPPPKAQVGSYTAVLPLAAPDSSLPAGNGYGTLTLTATGIATFTGALGDGTGVHLVGSVDSHGGWPFYFYKPTSKTASAEMALGTLTANVAPAATGYTATLDWFREPNDPLYPDGFTGEIALQAGRYKAPAVNYTAATVTFSGGDLTTSFTENITISTKGVVLGTSPFKMTLNAATGLFTGSFLDTTSNKSLSFNGALLQSASGGLGLFTAKGGATGSVSLQKTP